MSKRIVPPVPKPGENRMKFDEAVRENLQIITGQRVDALVALPSDASTDEIIAKINEVIARLQ